MVLMSVAMKQLLKWKEVEDIIGASLSKEDTVRDGTLGRAFKNHETSLTDRNGILIVIVFVL